MAGMDTIEIDTYYRPPVGSTPVLIRTERGKHRAQRYHLGARLADGPLLVPEACNLDMATAIVYLGNVPLPADALDTACRRCFPR